MGSHLTPRFNGPRLALLASAAERGRSPHKWRGQSVAGWQRLSAGAVGRMRHVGMMRLGALSLALVVFALPLAIEAQPARTLPRLCFLTFDPGTPQSSRFDPFFQALRDLDYVDGQTISIDYLSASGRGEQFPVLAADCLRLKADIVVVTTTPAAEAAKNATRTIPIVMHSLGDPVGTGLVASLARPGGNVTGTTLMASGLAAKRLGLLKEIVPRLSRVLVLSYLSSDPIATPQVKELETAAVSLGVKLLVQDIRTADDLPAAFDAGARERVEGFLTTAESIFVVQRTRVVQLAAQHRLPGMYPYRLMVDAGGLMAYDPTSDLQRRTAIYVERILKGAKPADLPVEQPTKFELIINRKTAKALRLTIPSSLLLRADQIID